MHYLNKSIRLVVLLLCATSLAATLSVLPRDTDTNPLKTRRNPIQIPTNLFHNGFQQASKIAGETMVKFVDKHISGQDNQEVNRNQKENYLISGSGPEPPTGNVPNVDPSAMTKFFEYFVDRMTRLESAVAGIKTIDTEAHSHPQVANVPNTPSSASSPANPNVQTVPIVDDTFGDVFNKFVKFVSPILPTNALNTISFIAPETKSSQVPDSPSSVSSSANPNVHTVPRFGSISAFPVDRNNAINTISSTPPVSTFVPSTTQSQPVEEQQNRLLDFKVAIIPKTDETNNQHSVKEQQNQPSQIQFDSITNGSVNSVQNVVSSTDATVTDAPATTVVQQTEKARDEFITQNDDVCPAYCCSQPVAGAHFTCEPYSSSEFDPKSPDEPCQINCNIVKDGTEGKNIFLFGHCNKRTLNKEAQQATETTSTIQELQNIETTNSPISEFNPIRERKNIPFESAADVVQHVLWDESKPEATKIPDISCTGPLKEGLQLSNVTIENARLTTNVHVHDGQKNSNDEQSHIPQISDIPDILNFMSFLADYSSNMIPQNLISSNKE